METTETCFGNQVVIITQITILLVLALGTFLLNLVFMILFVKVMTAVDAIWRAMKGTEAEEVGKMSVT